MGPRTGPPGGPYSLPRPVAGHPPPELPTALLSILGAGTPGRIQTPLSYGEKYTDQGRWHVQGFCRLTRTASGVPLKDVESLKNRDQRPYSNIGAGDKSFRVVGQRRKER
jgi:hypothetical protein